MEFLYVKLFIKNIEKTYKKIVKYEIEKTIKFDYDTDLREARMQFINSND